MARSLASFRFLHLEVLGVDMLAEGTRGRVAAAHDNADSL
jgi:hypothetical protein